MPSQEERAGRPDAGALPEGQLQLPYDLPLPTPPPTRRRATAAPNDHDAVWSFVLALASVPMLYVVGMGLIVAVVSLLLARSARRNIARSGGAVGGAGLASAAVQIDWACFGLFVIMIVVAFFLFS